MSVEPIEERFRTFGWATRRVDGHDVASLVAVLDELRDEDDAPPQLVVADTVKGRGVARMENDVAWHVGNLGPDDYEAVRSELLEGVVRGK